MIDFAMKEVAVKEIKEIKEISKAAAIEKRQFLHNQFESRVVPVEGRFEKSKTILDDKGVAFREGNKLLPENKFEINGYRYETDGLGRVTKAEGKLRIEEEYTRKMEDVKNYDGQEYRKNDERGHIIAHEFGGSDKLENLVPMDWNVNHGAYSQIERNLKDAVESGANVKLKVEPIYEGKSTRPIEFKVSSIIDGEKEITMIKNGVAA